MIDFLDLVRETFRGKSLGRILLNQALPRALAGLRGRVLDIGGAASSHERYLDLSAVELVTTNIDPRRSPTIIHDFNTPFPFKDGTFDAALMVNVVYIFRDPAAAARETFRVLKPGGRLHAVVPLVFPECPEPDDYRRYTAQGARAWLEEAGFAVRAIRPIGGRAAAAEFLTDPAGLVAPLRLCMRIKALMLDATLLRKANRVQPAPISYIVTAEKPA